MQEPAKEKKTDIMEIMETKLVTFGGILLGILLLVIGDAQAIKGVTYAGKFILPVALFWGGLCLKDESVGIRITLIALGGITALGLLATSIYSVAGLL
jgi:hypothetical protein